MYKWTYQDSAQKMANDKIEQLIKTRAGSQFRENRN